MSGKSFRLVFSRISTNGTRDSALGVTWDDGDAPAIAAGVDTTAGGSALQSAVTAGSGAAPSRKRKSVSIIEPDLKHTIEQRRLATL
jgi:hypothetical protein